MESTAETDCQHNIGGRCAVASTLAGLNTCDIPANRMVCRQCQQVYPPKSINQITARYAAGYLHSRKKEIPESLRKVLLAQRSGVGTELESLLERVSYWAGFVGLGWLFAKDDDCSCNPIRNQLNNLTIQECIRRKFEFAKILAANFAKKSWATKWLKVLAIPAAYWFIGLAIHYAKAGPS